MGKGFGIAALIFAIIAIFVPLFGIFISAFAIVLAVIAALAKDRVFATAVPLIAGVNTFFLSPTVWPTLLAEATQNGMTSQSLTAIIWSFLAAPFVVMALDGVMTTEPKAVSVGASMRQTPPAALSMATGDAGEDTWRLIAGLNDKALLEEFITRFPDHPRALMARVAVRNISEYGARRENLHSESAAPSKTSSASIGIQQTGSPTSKWPLVVGILFLMGASLALFVYQKQLEEAANQRAEQAEVQRQRAVREVEAQREEDAQRQREAREAAAQREAETLRQREAQVAEAQKEAEAQRQRERQDAEAQRQTENQSEGDAEDVNFVGIVKSKIDCINNVTFLRMEHGDNAIWSPKVSAIPLPSVGEYISGVGKTYFCVESLTPLTLHPGGLIDNRMHME